MTKNRLYAELFPRGATTVPELRKAAKIWAKRNALISPQELEGLLIACITDPRPMVKCMGGILLDYLPIQRKSLNPFLYEKWLDHVTGWGEIDAICYGHVTAEEMLADFTNWKRLLQTLSQSENINKRRAAMVFLTKPVKHSQDLRLSKLAFSLIDTQEPGDQHFNY